MTATAHLYKVIQDGAGNKIPGANVSLCTPGTTSPISEALFLDEALTIPQTNPYVSIDGVIDVYLAAPKTVALRVQYGSTITIQDYLDVLPNAENVLVTSTPLAITNDHYPTAILQVIDADTAEWVDPPTGGGGGGDFVPIGTTGGATEDIALHYGTARTWVGPNGDGLLFSAKDPDGDWPNWVLFGDSEAGLFVGNGDFDPTDFHNGNVNIWWSDYPQPGCLNITLDNPSSPYDGELQLDGSLCLNENGYITFGASGVGIPDPGGIRIGSRETTSASGQYAIALGKAVTADADGALGIGTDDTGIGAIASGVNSISIGGSSTATGEDSTAIGYETQALADNSLALNGTAHSVNSISIMGPATGDGAVTVGQAATSSGAGAIAVGQTAGAAGSGAIAIGQSAGASADGAIAIGLNHDGSTFTRALSQDSVAVGGGAVAGSTSNISCVAIGPNASATHAWGIALGGFASTSTPFAISIGDSSSADGVSSVAIGSGTHVSKTGDVAVGAGAIANSGAGNDSVALGQGAHSSANASTSLGSSAAASADSALAVGFGALASGQSSVSVGNGAQTSAINALALGSGAHAGHFGGVAIGVDNAGNAAVTAATNDFILGVAAHNVKIPGKFACNGNGPHGKFATPVTLADVIAILQAFGFCS